MNRSLTNKSATFVMDSSKLHIIGLGGVTCGGKTTITERIKNEFDKNENLRITIIRQDDFYLPEHMLSFVPEVNCYNWDTPEAVEFDKIVALVHNIANENKLNNVKDVIIIDGNMIYCYEPLSQLITERYFFTSSYEKCKAIRDTRVYVPPDLPGFFDKVVWPAYLEHERRAKEKPENFIFLNSAEYDLNYRTLSLNLRKWFTNQWLLLTNEKLQIDDAVDFVTAPSNGAIASFIGTTRNSFENKTVVSLMYECYEEMAYKEMDKVCNEMRDLWPQLDRVAMFHRLGNVPVTEASVIIAVSTPHRKESFLACEFAINTLKKSVPIWKKELYSDGTSSWKENKCN